MSDIGESLASSVKPVKTKQQYSRNVKKLKVRLAYAQQEIAALQIKVNNLSNTSNDKTIALKIAKFAKERNFTPEMLFRFADKSGKGQITKNELKETFERIGLKLSSQQLLRLQYLIDEDLSGVISLSQYNSYLYAFGIKKQFSGDDPLIINALKKLDLNKIKLIAEENNKDQDGLKKNRKRNLINYQQFIKYCHKHLPGLSNKELASIFNRLERNGLVDLEQLIEYINSRERQEQKLKKRNTETDSKKQGPDVEDKTLKGLILALLKNRPKNSKSQFHSSQFQRLERKLGRERGSLLIWFRRIDTHKKGSFGFNELIIDYIQNQSKDLIFGFRLMGIKLVSNGEKPEGIVASYNQNNQNITSRQFDKFLDQEFEISDINSKKLWALLAGNASVSLIKVERLIQAMQLQTDQRRLNYVMPALGDTYGRDFFKEECSTMLLNPFVALRNCITIVEQFQKAPRALWDDYQFGPIFSDPAGQSSIGMEIPCEDLQWIRAEQIGMKQFFFAFKQYAYQSSPQCLHDILPKTLITLMQNQEDLLWNKKKIDYTRREITEQDLKPLFYGIYPQVFHSFAKHGIYVFKFFMRERWVYIMVDDKIPCNVQRQPLFTFYKDKKYSWISLIEKAYAKAHGSYGKMFSLSTPLQFIYQFTRLVPVNWRIPKNTNIKTEQEKNSIWKTIAERSNAYPDQVQRKLYCMADETTQGMCANIETGFMRNKLLEILNSVEVNDQKCKNSHKSHRLLLLEKKLAKNEIKWNFAWTSELQNNKLAIFKEQIERVLKGSKSKNSVIQENVLVTNFKTFRQIFSNMIQPYLPSYIADTILRKRLEFEEKVVCRYIIKPKKSENRLIFSLNHIRGPTTSNTILLELKTRDSKQIQSYHIKGCFGAWEVSLPMNQERVLELSIKNWHKGEDYHYSLTFYFQSPQFELKERDRHMPFKRVYHIDEEAPLIWANAKGKENHFILANYYRNADKRGICGCC